MHDIQSDRCRSHRIHWLSALPLLLLTGLLATASVRAETYYLAVPPFMDREQGETQFTEFARYLSDKTGEDVQIRASANPIAFWESLKRGDFDLVLDGPHLADYRVQRLDHHVIAKVKGLLSFTLVMRPDNAVFEADELIGQKVAITPAPSLCAVQIEGFYPNIMRRPELIEVSSHEVALLKLRSGEVDAAFIPTPLTAQNPDLVLVAQSEQVPHSAMTAGPRVPARMQRQIRAALVGAQNDQDGARVLEVMNVYSGFENASDEMYASYSNMLTGIWAY
ncbi:MAG: PhnD/SsuA/transferrin family substrate-binding protein [Chromatiales bacterium]|nr:PhnD/SsuA/transferrin family substrate-binding protein [Gammaproteobacteria bacterium]MCP5352915.1 PhnD/SsuA/transferrin family substrate-binding protein [Chromatiales bacterium]